MKKKKKKPIHSFARVFFNELSIGPNNSIPTLGSLLSQWYKNACITAEAGPG